jgi:hypothetical protein
MIARRGPRHVSSKAHAGTNEPFVSRNRSSIGLIGRSGATGGVAQGQPMRQSKSRRNRSPPATPHIQLGPSIDSTSGRSRTRRGGPRGFTPSEAAPEVATSRPLESRCRRRRDAVGRTRPWATHGLDPAAQARWNSPRVGLRSAPLRPSSHPGRQDAQHAELRLQQAPAPQGRRRGAAGDLHHRARSGRTLGTSISTLSASRDPGSPT